MAPKVIFITGAGSSAPYGFPTGAQLRQEIIRLCKNANYDNVVPSVLDTNRNRYLPFGKELDELEEFSRRFEASSHSIDAFCYEENNSDITELSKLLIGYILREATKGYKLKSSFEEDWLQSLIGIATRFADSNSLKCGNLVFITFNYDCVIEYKLEEAIQRFSKLGKESIADFFSSITVDHVYGRLNPNLPPDGLSRLKEYSSEILLMRDGANVLNSLDFIEKYQKIFEPATYVLFTGFGFDPINLSAIGVPKVLEDPGIGKANIIKIFRTTSRVSEPSQLDQIQSRFPKLGKVSPGISCNTLVNSLGDSIRSQLELT